MYAIPWLVGVGVWYWTWCNQGVKTFTPWCFSTHGPSMSLDKSLWLFLSTSFGWVEWEWELTERNSTEWTGIQSRFHCADTTGKSTPKTWKMLILLVDFSQVIFSRSFSLVDLIGNIKSICFDLQNYGQLLKLKCWSTVKYMWELRESTSVEGNYWINKTFLTGNELNLHC